MRLKAAEWFHKQGFTLIPLEVGGKRPLVPWQGYQLSPPDEEQMDAWATQYPGCNWGLLTGHNEHQVVVLDADTPEAEAWCQANVPPTWTVKTPRGKHYYLRVPGGGRVSNGAYGGLDLRGWGGYVVAPGSEVNGVQYQLSRPVGMTELSDLPVLGQDLLRAAERWKAPAQEPAQTFDFSFDATDVPPDFTRPEDVQVGQRNNALARFAGWAIAQKGEPRAAWEWVKIWNSKLPDPLEKEEVRRTFRSVLAKHVREHGGFQAPAEEVKQTRISLRDYVLNASELAARHTPMNWLIDGLILDRGIVVITAPTGLGKSLLAWELAGCVAAGRPFLGRWAPGSWRRVLIVDGEMVVPVLENRARLLYDEQYEDQSSVVEDDDGRMVYAYRDLFRHRISVLPSSAVVGSGQEMALNLRAAVDRRTGKKTPSPHLEALLEYLHEYKAEAMAANAPHEDYGMVILDNVMSLAPGIDENLAQEVTEFMHDVAVRIRSLGYSCVLIHHSGKDVTKGARGSSAWTGFADLHLSLGPWDQETLGARPDGWKKAMSMVVLKNRHDARVQDCGIGFGVHQEGYLTWGVVDAKEAAGEEVPELEAGTVLTRVMNALTMGPQTAAEIVRLVEGSLTGDPMQRVKQVNQAITEGVTLGYLVSAAGMLSLGEAGPKG